MKKRKNNSLFHHALIALHLFSYDPESPLNAAVAEPARPLVTDGVREIIENLVDLLRIAAPHELRFAVEALAPDLKRTDPIAWDEVTAILHDAAPEDFSLGQLHRVPVRWDGARDKLGNQAFPDVDLSVPALVV